MSPDAGGGEGGHKAEYVAFANREQMEKTLPLGSSMMRRLSPEAVSTALLPGRLIVTPCNGGTDSFQPDAGYSNSARQRGGSRSHNEASYEHDMQHQLASSEPCTLDAIRK